MKRSTMVLRIEKILAKIYGKSSHEEASEFLKDLEEEGMSPPSYRTDIYIRADCDYAWVNEWEQEDLNSHAGSSFQDFYKAEVERFKAKASEDK